MLEHEINDTKGWFPADVLKIKPDPRSKGKYGFLYQRNEFC
jgi:hypothetical protein